MKKLHFARKLCVFISLLVVPQICQAIIIYDEGISGDISSATTDPLLNFSFGNNIVLGNATITVTSSPSYDPDAFSFVVPNGTSLSAMSVDYTNITMFGATTELYVAYYLRDSLNVPLGSSGFVAVSDSGSVIIPISGLPLGSGTYRLSTTYSWNGDFNDGGNFDYALDFEVTAVPIPAAIWLFGSGLIGLIGIARRKKYNA